MRTPDDDANTEDRPALLSRTISGGLGGRDHETITIGADGTVRCSGSDGGSVDAALTAEQVTLISSICAASGFRDLPSYVDGPVSRSDPFTWTYRVGEHQVSIRDPERAPDAVPAALRIVDAIVDGVIAAELSSAAGDAPLSLALRPQHTNVYVTGVDITDPAGERS